MTTPNENENKPQKPPRKKKAATKFMVLKAQPLPPNSANGQMYEDMLGATTIKDAREQIKKQKIVGDLLIVSIRRQGKTTVQETLDLGPGL